MEEKQERRFDSAGPRSLRVSREYGRCLNQRQRLVEFRVSELGLASVNRQFHCKIPFGMNALEQSNTTIPFHQDD